MTAIFLNVPFSAKDEAKAFGARWDAAKKMWYVLEGTELAPFERWLTVKPKPAVAIDDAGEKTPAGQSLTSYLRSIGAVIAREIRGTQWIRCEVGLVQARERYVNLELIDHEAAGTQSAKVRASMSGAAAEAMLQKFREATGQELVQGIKVLLLVKPRFDPSWGLSLVIEDLDPSFTVGDMEAKLKALRSKLKLEGLFDRNRTVPLPWDYNRVIVISPKDAAALGDFRGVADRLQQSGVCDFEYHEAVFQGLQAAESLRSALVAALLSHHESPSDALVIIRGGGAKADLYWLNEEHLARQICVAPLPVITGIGHERDSTILDEVAAKCCGTPSKVAELILGVIDSRVREVVEAQGRILAAADAVVSKKSAAVEERFALIQRRSAQLTQERSELTRDAYEIVKTTASEVLNTSLGLALTAIHQIRSRAQASLQVVDGRISHLATLGIERASMLCARTDERVEKMVTDVEHTALIHSDLVERDLMQQQQIVLTEAHALMYAGDEAATALKKVIAAEAAKALHATEVEAKRLIAEVLNVGPDRTIGRGFVLVKSGAEVVSRAAVARTKPILELQFRDGSINVTGAKNA